MKRGFWSGLVAVLLVGGGAVALWKVAPGGPAPATSAPGRPRPVTTSATTASVAPDPARRPATVAPSAEAAPGEPFVVELMDPPETHYEARVASAEDRAYSKIVESLGRANLTYDPALGRAARELALQQSLLGGLVPTDIVEFILRASGAVDRTVEQGYVAMSSKDDAALSRQIEKLLAQTDASEPLRIGVGEAWIVGANPDRVAGVLLGRGAVRVEPVPRRMEPGETWSLRGTLPAGYRSPNALVMRPDGELVEAAVQVSGGGFRVDVAMGPGAGTWEVSVGAEGPFGHTPLVQLPVEVGRPLPDSYTTSIPPDESRITTVPAAEKLALDLLNRDRARFGLKALEVDPALSAIARGHSEDMRDNKFFGHVSPRTGGPAERLSAGRYRALTYAENVALHGSIHQAESALLASLGHRRNILHPKVTRVGIGVAIQEENGRRSFHVTQLFATPVEDVSPAAVSAAVLGRMNARRRELGLGALATDARIDRIARSHAEAAARGGPLDGLSKAVLADMEREGLSRGGARVWALRTGEVGEVMPAAALVEGAYSRAAVGVAQDAAGAVFVVVIAAGD